MKRTTHLLASLVGLLLAAAPAAHAQAPADEVRDFLLGTDNRRAVDQVVRATASRFFADCRDLKEAGQVSVSILRPIRLGLERKPVEGTWKEALPVSLCGVVHRFNVLNGVGPDGSVRRIALLTGTTRADPPLQRDASVPVLAAAAAKTRDIGCKDLSVVDTSVGDFGPAVIPGRPPWRETWTVDACRTSVAIDIDFTPDATGTGFSVKMDQK